MSVSHKKGLLGSCSHFILMQLCRFLKLFVNDDSEGAVTFLKDVFDASFSSTFSIFFLSPKSLPKSSAKMVVGINHSSRLCLSTVFLLLLLGYLFYRLVWIHIM